jgi:diaminopropionate ammonia-lyase
MSRKSFFINTPDNVLANGLTSSILKNSDSLLFHSKKKEYSPTPLLSRPDLAREYGVGEILVKDESHRLGLNAFKGVGAYYAISLLSSNLSIDTLCTATDGNHGRAVAWSAKKFSKKSVIVVPGDITENRVKAIEKEGAEVIRTRGNYDDACEVALEMSKKDGFALIQDTAYEGYEEIPAQIMAGYLTIFREMETSIHAMPDPEVDLVFLQVGVGSFAASGAWYYLNRYGSNRPKIVITEPNEADAMFYSFEMGKRSVSKGTNRTIMAGLNCNTPSSSAWDILKSACDVSIRLDDSYCKEAMRALNREGDPGSRILSGESGAAGLAGLIAIMTDSNYEYLINEIGISESTRVLVINTEGPTDRDIYKLIVSQ